MPIIERLPHLHLMHTSRANQNSEPKTLNEQLEETYDLLNPPLPESPHSADGGIVQALTKLDDLTQELGTNGVTDEEISLQVLQTWIFQGQTPQEQHQRAQTINDMSPGEMLGFSSSLRAGFDIQRTAKYAKAARQAKEQLNSPPPEHENSQNYHRAHWHESQLNPTRDLRATIGIEIEAVRNGLVPGIKDKTLEFDLLKGIDVGMETRLGPYFNPQTLILVLDKLLNPNIIHHHRAQYLSVHTNLGIESLHLLGQIVRITNATGLAHHPLMPSPRPPKIQTIDITSNGQNGIPYGESQESFLTTKSATHTHLHISTALASAAKWYQAGYLHVAANQGQSTSLRSLWHGTHLQAKQAVRYEVDDNLLPVRYRNVEIPEANQIFQAPLTSVQKQLALAYHRTITDFSSYLKAIDLPDYLQITTTGTTARQVAETIIDIYPQPWSRYDVDPAAIPMEGQIAMINGIEYQNIVHAAQHITGQARNQVEAVLRYHELSFWQHLDKLKPSSISLNPSTRQANNFLNAYYPRLDRGSQGPTHHFNKIWHELQQYRQFAPQIQ